MPPRDARAGEIASGTDAGRAPRSIAGRRRSAARGWAAGLLLCLLAGGALAAAPARDDAQEDPTPDVAAPGWLPRGTAELRVLDVLSAQATPLSVPVGHSAQVQSLTITVRACLVRPPDRAADSTARLDVVDAKGAGTPFHGWMFSGEPQLAMVESPTYGVLLLGCK